MSTGLPRDKPRPWHWRVADRLVTLLQRLPPAECGYTIARDLRIPSRDGFDLLADIYTPAGAIKGTLLVRSPYGWRMLMAVLTGGVYASRGYRVILARCRGTFGSGGVFKAMQHEVEDAADTVAWMREQPWFEGKFATFGGSYLGFTQWALLMDPPPELRAAVISIAPHDFQESVYSGGAFNLADFLGWSHQMAHQEDPLWRRMLSLFTARRRAVAAMQELPLADAGDRLLAGGSTWYRDWVSRRAPDDPFWSAMKLGDALERTQVPVLLQVGWQDIFLERTIEQYKRLNERGIEVALTIGPWTHVELVTRGGSIMVGETLDWLGEHLSDNGLHSRAAPVKIFVTGAGQWRDIPEWPPATRERYLYPVAGGGLSENADEDRGQAVFTYDPADPTPTIGGRVLVGGGYTEDSALALRRDVLCFTGSVLRSPLEIIGCPVLELAHLSDNPHADLFARISEVSPDGRSRNVSDGFVRLDPSVSSGGLRLELDAVAHRFKAGNRIRLLLAGGCHPRLERNLGTGEDPAASSAMAPSRRTIDLGASRLVMPTGDFG